MVGVSLVGGSHEYDETVYAFSMLAGSSSSVSKVTLNAFTRVPRSSLMKPSLGIFHGCLWLI